METEKALELLERLEGETVYLIEVVDGKVSPGIYNPIIFDEDDIDYLAEEILEGNLEFIRCEYRGMRDFEHYAIYILKNYN